jgi:hypothetical protein
MSVFDAVLALEIVREFEYYDARARHASLHAELELRNRERLSRVRWLEEHRAERSFPCGFAIVPEPDALPRPTLKPVAVPPPPMNASRTTHTGPVPPMPVPPPLLEASPPTRLAEVTAAVLSDALAFLVEDGMGEIDEAGRIPRTAIGDIDVVDTRGVHVPEPMRETIEAPQLVFTVLRWTNSGVPDEDRFAFRSPWLAWQAGRRMLEAKRG